MKEFVFRCTVKVASRSRPSPVTCLVVTEARGAGVIFNIILTCNFLIFAIFRVRNSYTILDCVYSDTNGVFYILDMMCWDGYQVKIDIIWNLSKMCFRKLFLQYYDCDTEFRLAWVQQKFIESQVDSDFKTQIVNWNFFGLCLFNRSFGWGQGSILTAFSPFQSIRYSTPLELV